jgi:hypothetical protein
MQSAPLLLLICFLVISLPTELRLCSRLSPSERIQLNCSLSFAFCLSLHSLFYLLFLFLVHCRFRFERNCGFVAGFLRLNAFGSIAPSRLLSLFRLNCGFVVGFLRLNAFSFTAVYPFLPFYLSLLSSACSSSFWCNVGCACDGIAVSEQNFSD